MKIFFFVLLLSSAAYPIEQIGNTNLEWFTRCEMNQPGFDLKSVSYDYLKWYFPDQYKEYVNDPKKHIQALEELQKWFGLVSICYPKMEYFFILSLTGYRKDQECCIERGLFRVEPVPSTLNLFYTNTIYSAIPSKFNIKLTNFELPIEIPITERNIGKLNEQGCTKINRNGGSVVLLKIDADIKRITKGEYVSKPLKGAIYTYCPMNPKKSEILMEFDYANNGS